MEIKELEQILLLLKQGDVTEFELQSGDTRIKLARGAAVAAAARQDAQASLHPAIVSAPSAAVVNGHAHKLENTANELPAHFVKVESPIVGTFYRRPSPDAEAFVSEGSVVKKGDTLCIIEAMKLMNELDAPCDGKVERILLSDGKVVEYGEPLFIINPQA